MHDQTHSNEKRKSIIALQLMLYFILCTQLYRILVRGVPKSYIGMPK